MVLSCQNISGDASGCWTLTNFTFSFGSHLQCTWKWTKSGHFFPINIPCLERKQHENGVRQTTVCLFSLHHSSYEFQLPEEAECLQWTKKPWCKTALTPSLIWPKVVKSSRGQLGRRALTQQSTSALLCSRWAQADCYDRWESPHDSRSPLSLPLLCCRATDGQRTMNH